MKSHIVTIKEHMTSYNCTC